MAECDETCQIAVNDAVERAEAAEARVAALTAALELVRSDLSVLHLGGSIAETIIQIDAALDAARGA